MRTFGMTYSRKTTAISELAGQPVSTQSEEWRIGIEAWAVLKMSKQEQDVIFNGRKDEGGRSIGRGVIGIRGSSTAEEIQATLERLQEDRSGRSWPVAFPRSALPSPSNRRRFRQAHSSGRDRGHG
jgi:hypothetical protein